MTPFEREACAIARAVMGDNTGFSRPQVVVLTVLRLAVAATATLLVAALCSRPGLGLLASLG